MEPFLKLLLMIVAGFVILGVGFNFRDRPWGIALLTVGAVSMFSLLFYKLALSFG
ncbi:membrane protein [Stutzerimonas azotifigens]|uniref:membrane protein n=1 Tax=Stutzerimonas azotifigens TaxID=291995 RepID=UPI0004053F77|nr:membrane protein [Stutzerimonas azotifigens]